MRTIMGHSTEEYVSIAYHMSRIDLPVEPTLVPRIALCDVELRSERVSCTISACNVSYLSLRYGTLSAD